MSREDIHTEYRYGDVEIVELGIDHNGKKQWYASTMNGWNDIGKSGTLTLSAEHFGVGTRVELNNLIPQEVSHEDIESMSNAELIDALCRSPAIEILSPRAFDLMQCDTIQDIYDMMRKRIRQAVVTLAKDTYKVIP